MLDGDVSACRLDPGHPYDRRKSSHQTPLVSGTKTKEEGDAILL